MDNEEQNEYDISLSEAELQLVIYAVSQFYAAKGDAAIGNHQADLVLNAFRKIRKAFIDKNYTCLFVDIQGILDGEDQRLKS